MHTSMAVGKKSSNQHQNSSQHGAKKSKSAKKPVHKKPVKPTLVAPNSNWAKLKHRIAGNATAAATTTTNQCTNGTTASKQHGKKRDLQVESTSYSNKKKRRETFKSDPVSKRGREVNWIDHSQIVGMDCEMVGVGISGKRSVLARCSIVDFDGQVLYDKKVRPMEKVTDFRTHVSGIRSRSLRNAIPFAQCLKEVGKILKDKIIVGHALKNDFEALMFTPPKHLIRDTAKYRPYMRRKMNGTKLFPKSLKDLTQEFLGMTIQEGEHDSVEDARATLALYKREQFVWEKCLQKTKQYGGLVGAAPPMVVASQNDQPADQTHHDATKTTVNRVTNLDEEELALIQQMNACTATSYNEQPPSGPTQDLHKLVTMEYDE